jgi:hypothetical protein
MDRKYNDFNKFNRGSPRRGYSRALQPRELDRDKFRSAMEDARWKFRSGSDGARHGLRKNFPQDKSGGKTRERDREKEINRDDFDHDNFTEEFHERQVDYHKGFRKKKNDEDFRENCEGY